MRLRFVSEIFAGVNSYHLGSYAAIVVMPKVSARKGTEAQVSIPQNFCTFCFLFQLHNNTVEVVAPPFAFHLCFNMLERCCIRWSAERKQQQQKARGENEPLKAIVQECGKPTSSGQTFGCTCILRENGRENGVVLDVPLLQCKQRGRMARSGEH